MNIPASAIQPFKPCGIPVLALIVSDSDELQTIYDNLEMTYKLITDLELDDGSSWARETLEGCALESGASSVNVQEQPLRGSNRLGYMVYFHVKSENATRVHMRLLCNK
jgi:hypothetical protein